MAIKLTVANPVDGTDLDANGELIEIHISRRAGECRARLGGG